MPVQLERAATEPDAPDRPESYPSLPGLCRRLLHLAGLGALALAQPVLELIGDEPTFLVAHRLERAEIVLLAIALVLAPAVLLVPLEVLLARAPATIRRTGHGALIALASALIALPLLGRTAMPAALAALLALAVAAAAAALYLRVPALQLGVTVLTLGALVAVPSTFLLRPGVAAASVPRVHGVALPRIDAEAPVVMVVLDELPTSTLLGADGAIERARFPHLAALAERATFYRYAVGSSEATELALAAVFSGKQPRLGEVPTYRARPRNLFTLFGGSYRIWATEPTSYYCPRAINRQVTASGPAGARTVAVARDLRVLALHRLLPPAWTADLPPIGSAWAHFGQPAADRPGVPDEPPKRGFFRQAIEATHADRREPLETFLDSLDQIDGSRTLHLLHVLLPHKPWDLLSDGRRYPAPDETPGLHRDRWLGDRFWRRQAYHRQLLQTEMVDRFVGRMVARLEARGRFDRSLIVITADHGSAFMTGTTRRRADLGNIHEIMPVPLLIKAPGQRAGAVDDRFVTSVDLLATIVDLLGAEPPWPLEGRPAREIPPASATSGTVTLPSLQFLTKENGLLAVPAASLRRLEEVVAWKRRWFGSGEGALDENRYGPHGALVGRPVAELDAGLEGRARWRAALDDPEAYRDVDLDADELPAYLRAFVRTFPGTPQDGAVAVALNGVVAATVPLTERRVEVWHELYAMLPPSLFVAGDNEIVLYRIDPGDDETGDDEAGEPVLRFIPWHRP